MKPNFALTLSFEGIGLLHRAFPGWHLVGDVGLDSADLTGELTELRQKAHALDASGLRAKLVLPNDQVKYLQIDDYSGEDEEAFVRSSLDGATPYAVDDLAFDWTTKDGRLFIAAVARETLAEAEAFAVEHQFNPVCFVATPEGDDYAGEPFFGLTSYAKEDGIEDIDRDTAPIRVIGASKLPEPDVAVSADSEEAKEAEASADETSLDEAETETAPAEEEAAEEVTADAADAEPDEPSPAEDAEDETQETAAEEDDAEAEDEAASDDTADETDAAEEAEEEAEPATAFASIRARRDDGAPATPRLEGVVRDTARARITLGPAAKPDTPKDAPTVTGISDATLPEDETAESTVALVASPEQRLATPEPSVEVPAVEAPLPDTPPPAEQKPAFFTRRSRGRKKADTRTSAIPEPSDEKQRMTIFGAREQTAVGGKPRFLGLILTAVLLLFLIGVAAWASIFMDEGLARFFRSDDTPVVANLPTPEEAEAALSEEEELELASLTPDDAVSVLDDPATEILSRVNPSDLSPDEAKARYAATGIWQLAPEPSASPQPTELQDFYQTSLDPDLDFQDAVALPEASSASTDGMMFSPASPPSANTKFVFDNRGFVLATPDGAVTPDGVVVYAGQPAVTSPAKPGQTTITAEPEEAEPEIQQAAIRPRARPDDLAEQIERNALSGRTLSELASLRPKLRPKSAQEAAEEARKKAEAEAAAAQQAAAAAAATDPDAVEAAVASAAQATIAFSGATPQAVKASLKPRTKPRNFDKIVQRTKRNQQRQAQPEATQQQTVAVRATQKVTPKIPSKASVSKRATQRNAIKFKRVNLIGVYGTPSTRRALVRMSNGRYKKVKVGDRLDGGRVSAIGDSDLRYTKGGRTVVLKMPRG